MKITRRAFIHSTGKAAAGLVIGFRLGPSAHADETTSGEFAPNAYIRIGSDNVVRLWATRSEMGQGVRTLLPMILVDELGADWEKIVVEQASPEPRFKGIRLRTSGSGSAAGTWRPLRLAAATAREMLIGAAAQQWGLTPDACRTENGYVIHDASSRKLTFGQLAMAAAQMPRPTASALKDPKDFRLIGKPVKRRDSHAIVSGSAVYGLDVHVDGMLHAVIARCPHLGGKLVSFGPAPALKITGVKHVIPVHAGLSAGVAVVAVNTWAALKGREALRPVWSQGPDPDFDSDVFTQKLEHALTEPGYVIRREGDAPTALSRAARTMEAVYEYPFQAHAPLETMNCTASVRNDSCEIWVPTQAPEAAQQEAAKVLGIPPEAVKINITLLGGGFGRRLIADYVPEAVEIAKAAGRPVQVLWTREDDMRYGFFHPPKVEHIRAALDQNGFPAAWHHKSSGVDLSVIGMPSEDDKKNPGFYRDDGMPWGSFDNPYNFKDLWVDYVPVESPVPTGPWRAVMYPATVFARESFLDEIAHAAKLDPLALRLRLLEPDALDLKIRKVSRVRLQAVLKKAAEESGWGTPLPPAGNRLHGRGIACNIYDEDCYLAQVAEVSVDKDFSGIRVHRIVSAVDCGLALNPLGIEAQTESAIAWGMSAALGGKINFKNSQAQERSYADFKVLRMNDAPVCETHLIQGALRPGGFGETAVPTVAPAIANAIFAATGRRLRRLPMTVEGLTGLTARTRH